MAVNIIDMLHILGLDRLANMGMITFADLKKRAHWIRRLICYFHGHNPIIKDSIGRRKHARGKAVCSCCGVEIPFVKIHGKYVFKETI